MMCSVAGKEYYFAAEVSQLLKTFKNNATNHSRARVQGREVKGDVPCSGL